MIELEVIGLEINKLQINKLDWVRNNRIKYDRGRNYQVRNDRQLKMIGSHLY